MHMMPATRRAAMGTALAAGVAAMWPPASACAQLHWRLASNWPESNPHTRNLRLFAQDVQLASQGALLIEVHAGASLLKLAEIRRALQAGTVQMGEIMLAAEAAEDPIWEVDALPMLVRNFAGARRLAQLARPAIEQRLQQNGVTLLYTMPWPPTRLFSSFAMASLAPLRGTRLRTMTPMGGRLANLLGAYAARVEAEEPAMVSAGRIATSMLAPATMGVEMAAWSFARFYIPIDSAFFKNAVCVQTRAFNALSGGLRGIMMNAAGAAEIRGWAMASDEVGISEAALVSHGMMLRPASATLIADLTRVGAVMKEEWLGRAGGRGQRLLAALGS